MRHSNFIKKSFFFLLSLWKNRGSPYVQAYMVHRYGNICNKMTVSIWGFLLLYDECMKTNYTYAFNASKHVQKSNQPEI